MSELAELFSRDPMSYTKQNLDEIIARLREARAQFNLTNISPKKSASKVPAAPKSTTPINLDDLDI